MDERDLHEDDEHLDSEEDEQDDTELDDSSTPANTDGESDDSKKSEESKERQKLAWLKKIESGEKTLDDMPKNLEWLKKTIQEEKGKKEKPKESELEDTIQKILTERDAAREFDYLVEDLQNADISAEQEAQLKEEYESLLEDYSNPSEKQKLKALLTARRLVGLKDTTTSIRERRRKGMSLPPLSGTRKRLTVNNEKMTEIEKRLGGGLPPGFKA